MNPGSSGSFFRLLSTQVLRNGSNVGSSVSGTLSGHPTRFILTNAPPRHVEEGATTCSMLASGGGASSSSSSAPAPSNNPPLVIELKPFSSATDMSPCGVRYFPFSPSPPVTEQPSSSSSTTTTTTSNIQHVSFQQSKTTGYTTSSTSSSSSSTRNQKQTKSSSKKNNARGTFFAAASFVGVKVASMDDDEPECLSFGYDEEPPPPPSNNPDLYQCKDSSVFCTETNVQNTLLFDMLQRTTDNKRGWCSVVLKESLPPCENRTSSNGRKRSRATRSNDMPPKQNALAIPKTNKRLTPLSSCSVRSPFLVSSTSSSSSSSPPRTKSIGYENPDIAVDASNDESNEHRRLSGLISENLNISLNQTFNLPLHVSKCRRRTMASPQRDDFQPLLSSPVFYSSPSQPNTRGIDQHHFNMRNWTKEFQSILDIPLTQRGDQLQTLCRQFSEEATRIGEVIITERNLPYSRKSIKPIDGCGFAGGEKYHHNSIFFKYAIDTKGLYGDDMFAMKVAGHELKGLTAYMSCGMLIGLSFGLMCLIDYRGYRLIATSELPISFDTIRYGSCDGGNTIHCSDEHMNTLMERVANVLNLKGHYAGLNAGSRAFLHGPADLEGHLGRDGRYYVLDLSRVFPPERPSKHAEKGSFLYKLLRPELVASAPEPLSSDAFSRFGADEASEHNQQVADMTEHLLDTVIPKFARWMCTTGEATIAKRWRKRSPGIVDFRWLQNELHRSGINLRYLGKIRHHILHSMSCESTSLYYCIPLITTEMVARSLKHILRAVLRQVQSEDERVYRQAVALFFNRFSPVLFDGQNLSKNSSQNFSQNSSHNLSKNSSQNSSNSSLYQNSSNYQHSLSYWTDTVCLLMKKQFHFSLPTSSGRCGPQVQHLITHQVDRRLLFLRMEHLCGIVFHNHVSRQFSPSNRKAWQPLTADDIKQLLPKKKQMYAMTRIEADGLVECGRSKLGMERWQCLDLAREKYIQVLQLKPDDFVVLTNLGLVLVDLAKMVETGAVPVSKSKKSASHLFQVAYEKFQSSLRGDPEDYHTLAIWANSLCAQVKAKLESNPKLVHTSQGRAEIKAILTLAHEKYHQAAQLKPNDETIQHNWTAARLLQKKISL